MLFLRKLLKRVLKSVPILVCASWVWSPGVWAASNTGTTNTAHEYFEAGERAARAGDSLKAFLFYAKAARLEPLNTTYAVRAHTLQNSVAFTRPAVTEAEPSSLKSKTDPAIETVEAELVAAGLTDELAAALAPPRLQGKAGPQSLELRGDAQTAWTNLAAAFGLTANFDRGYQALPNVRADLNAVDPGRAIEMPQAIRALEAATDSFIVPMDAHQFLVARDNAQNRTQLIPTMTMAVPIPERITVQEAQEILTAVQQVLEIRRISLDAGKRVAYFRDSASKAIAARQMFETLSRPRAQIQVDVEFLSFSSAANLNYGLLPPTLAPIVPFALPSNYQIPALPSGIGGATFGGGASLLALGITDSTLFATLAKSSAETLIHTGMTVLDGQASTLHVGDKYPVITSSYSGVTGASNTNVPPGIQFVDLGLVLKVTPSVHENGEVTLDVDASFKTLGSVVLNGIPEISSQEFQGKVRLKDGEWGVLAGLVTASDMPTTTGIAGLSQIPVLGSLFSQKTRQTDLSDTLVVLKPRLVYLPPWESVTQPLWTGTESRPISAF